MICCSDVEQLESTVESDMVGDCSDVRGVTDDVVRFFLDKEATESPTVVTQDDCLRWSSIS